MKADNWLVLPVTKEQQTDIHSLQLQIIDFGLALCLRDVTRQDEFTGASKISGFECVAMLNNERWSFEVTRNYCLIT